MSYILDALKKLETERGSVASVSSTQRPPEQPGRLRYVVIVLLAVNVGLLGFWVFDHELGGDGDRHNQTFVGPTTSTDSAGPIAEPVEAGKNFPLLSAVPTEYPQRSSPAPTGAAEATAEVSSPREVAPRRVALNLLTGPDRSAFPSLLFSTHIYADAPEFRAVFINGRRHVEGDQVTAEVALHRVTEGGVELLYRSYLVEIGVLQEWE